MMRTHTSGHFRSSPSPAQFVPSYAAPGPLLGLPTCHKPLFAYQSPSPPSKPFRTLSEVTGCPVTSATSSTIPARRAGVVIIVPTTVWKATARSGRCKPTGQWTARSILRWPLPRRHANGVYRLGPVLVPTRKSPPRQSATAVARKESCSIARTAGGDTDPPKAPQWPG